MTEVKTADKNHIPILIGDVLKVFHFTGARRKKHYMYKQVVGICWLGGAGGKPKVPYFHVSHLSLGTEGYWLSLYEGVLADYEIVQSIECDHEERIKVV